MTLSRIIFYISLIVWLFPPLKQFRGKLFYYFLFLAISDPLTLLLRNFHVNSMPFYLFKDLLLVVLLWKPYIFRKKIPLIIIISLFIFAVVNSLHYSILHYFIIVVHGIIIYFIFKIFLNDVLEVKKIKIFYILILLYELSVLLKFIYVMIYTRMGAILYYTTTAFEIFLGILFIFISEDNTKLAIPVMSTVEDVEE